MGRRLVRESINFERTGDVKSSLGIGREAVIRKFFEDLGASDEKYTIEPNGEIIYNVSLFLNNNDKFLTKLPDNLTIDADLYIISTNLTELPKNLTVTYDLHLKGTKITELPDDLEVGRYIIVTSESIELIESIENSKFEEQLLIQ